MFNDDPFLLSRTLPSSQFISPPFLIYNVPSEHFVRPAYNTIEGNASARRETAKTIVDTYIAPSTGGPGSIYTSEAQRKALASKMRRLWGKPAKTSKGSRHTREGEREKLGNDDDRGTLDDRGRVALPPISKNAHESNAHTAGIGESEDHFRRSPERNHGGGNDGSPQVSGTDTVAAPEKTGGGRGDADQGDTDNRSDASSARTGRLCSDESDAWSVSYCYNTDGVHGADSYGEAGAEEEREQVDRALSVSLFDEILNQNAIPTIRQHSKSGLQ